MRAHCLQHVPFEDLAAIKPWLNNNTFEITFTRFYESDYLPAVNEIDWLIIMGGTMSVNDEKEHPWLIKEKEFVRQCIIQNKVVIGICLGAQLIASSLGYLVYKNSLKEIGWFPIKKIQNIKSSLFTELPDELTVFHWHGETFDLPEGAELIASSQACKNQIFTINEQVVAFQCHFETNSETLVSIDLNCKHELSEAPFIQKETDLINYEKIYSEKMNEVLYQIFNKLLIQKK